MYLKLEIWKGKVQEEDHKKKPVTLESTMKMPEQIYNKTTQMTARITGTQQM